MSDYPVKRILATLPVMTVVAVFMFSLLQLRPGDPAAVIAGDHANPQDVEHTRQKLGLNERLGHSTALLFPTSFGNEDADPL
jgi:peptide/nickel transport system permease protein